MLFLELPKIWNTKKQKESFNLLLIANRKWDFFLPQPSNSLNHGVVMNDKGIGPNPPNMPNKFRNLQCIWPSVIWLVSFMRSLPTLFREKIFPGWCFHFSFHPKNWWRWNQFYEHIFQMCSLKPPTSFNKKVFAMTVTANLPTHFDVGALRGNGQEKPKKSPPTGDSGYTPTPNLPLLPRKYSLTC